MRQPALIIKDRAVQTTGKLGIGRRKLSRINHPTLVSPPVFRDLTSVKSVWNGGLSIENISPTHTLLYSFSDLKCRAYDCFYSNTTYSNNMSETFRDPASLQNPLVKHLGYERAAVIVANGVHLYMPDDVAINNGLKSQAVLTDYDFSAQPLPLLLSSGIQSLNNDALGHRILADVSFDVSHTTLAATLDDDLRLRKVLGRKMFERLQKHTNMTDLRSPAMRFRDTTLEINYRNLPALNVTSKVTTGELGHRVATFFVSAEYEDSYP